MMTAFPVTGTGLGLRRALMGPLSNAPAPPVDFLEVAPENWIPMGGRLGRDFRALTERFPFVTHGLSLSLGGPEPLDFELLGDIKTFLAEHRIRAYTEHLSYCGDHAHLYDLMPIPFTEEAVHYVADRIRRVQDFLGQRIAIEHVSYYATPPVRESAALSELAFVRAVLEEADCGLLLDVNNAYVNGINHGYDAADFIRGLPGERIFYVHVAGHFDEAEDLKVDTHGAPVIDPVWRLLEVAYERFGVLPTLLERDFNFPPFDTLCDELRRIGDTQQRHGGPAAAMRSA
ncbi:DUF692 domain-containing protein [Alcanivorax sp. MM125-6]|uniref:HvfB family MNIO-type RiPP peptide maturase n=1 Tax=Alloalcanivorax profundimaris TaxID=2735259 RepID=UPI001E43D744|nr:DUF692 domain-containing protein [Alloalcanivorax profundimaris]MCQ6263696.1 DUF692 domain-containing protein [Alcanivorax sp. MM125-6]|tara:strand:- start:47670 stop:48533 length:864 start_codon:yes stop_codon:yes gene_type:complete